MRQDQWRDDKTSGVVDSKMGSEPDNKTGDNTDSEVDTRTGGETDGEDDTRTGGKIDDETSIK